MMKIKMKKISTDFSFNLLAFALIVAIQQLVCMPYIAKTFPQLFSNVILVYTIVNVFVYFTGGALGSTLLVRYKKYTGKTNKGDYFILIIGFSIIAILLNFCLLFIKLVFKGDLFICIIWSILACFKEFYRDAFRLYDKVTVLLLQSIFYCVGALVVIFALNSYFHNPYLIFMLAELYAAITYLLYRKICIKDLKPHITNEFMNTTITYLHFAVQTLIGSMVTYADRFLIVPLLGKEYLITLYSITVASKCTGVLLNPLRSVLLARLAHMEDNNSSETFNFMLKKTSHFAFPLFLVNIVSSTVILYFLYNKQFSNGIYLVPIVSMGATFASISSVYLTVAMRFVAPKRLTMISILKFVIFVIIAYFLTKKYLLIGFVVSMLSIEIVVFILYFTLIKKALNKSLIKDVN